MKQMRAGRIYQLGASLGVMAIAVLGANASVSQGQASTKTVDFAKDIRPILQKHCASCHAVKDPPGGVNPLKALTTAEVQADDKTWERILNAIKLGHMPPESAPQPTAEQRNFLVAGLQSILSGNCTTQDPGRVTIRRLNRAEYANTIRDLMGIDFVASDDFPNDDVGYGFDNIGDVLSMSPLLLEKYLNAAEAIADAAIVLPGAKTARYEADKFGTAKGTTVTPDSDRMFYTNSEVSVDHSFPASGAYRIRVRAFGTQAGSEPCQMRISIDDKAQPKIDVAATEDKPTDYEIPIDLDAGKHKISIAFLNDYYDEKFPDPKHRDRNLVLRYLEIVGPLGGVGVLPPSTTRIMPYVPHAGQELAAAKQFLTSFANRAYRRPARPEEIDALLRVFQVPLANKESFARCMQVAVSAVLVSPQFLFRVELDSNAKGTRLLTGYEIASRLSYFLWASCPDEALLQLAAANKLNDPATLEAQVDRMLKDPRAKSLTDNFATQWLQLRKLNNLRLDPTLYPDANGGLRKAMLTETSMFFTDIVANDRSILEFLDSKTSFLNGPLAAYYDIPDVSGDDFRRVELKNPVRGGLLGQGAVLMVSSNPTRTSPTKRGRWILEQILGTPPPPPPPGVGDLKPKPANDPTLTLRKQMEAHRSNPDCAGCHARMDPLGFSLENFSASGQWRNRDESGVPIDASGVLPDGTKFAGPVQLKAILMAKKDLFAQALAEKFLIYALGRGVTLRDDCAIDVIAKRCQRDGYRISSLIKAVVTSEPFRKRKIEGNP